MIFRGYCKAFVFFFAVLVLGLWDHLGYSSSDSDVPRIKMQIKIHDTQGIPSQISGQMEVSSLQVSQASQAGQVCFYLPYQDPEYGFNRGDMQRFQLLTSSHRRPHFAGGKMVLSGPHVGRQILGDAPYFLRIELPKGWDSASTLKLTYQATLPRLERSLPNEWVYDGFHPQLLKRCPNGLNPRLEIETLNSAYYEAQINIPDDWQYLGLGKSKNQVTEFRGLMTYPAFMLVKGFVKKEIRIGRTSLIVAHQSEKFLDLIPTLASGFNSLVEIFGPYPFESLTIVESSELQRHTVPGLIAINRPPQLIFDKVQKDLLNWQHWTAVMQLATQWMGGMVFADSVDDQWLLSGLSEYGALVALKELSQRFDLFNEGFLGSKWFTFSYLQQTEVLASMLKKGSPYSVLTRSDYRSFEPIEEQNKLLFLRQTSAIRQVAAYVGPARLNGFLRKLANDYSFKSLSPAQFIAQIDLLPSPFSASQRLEVSRSIKKWWTLDGWPDFALKDVEEKALPEGKWSVIVKVDQLGGLDHAPVVVVEDNEGKTQTALGQFNVALGHWEAKFILNAPLDAVDIDPLHHSFDSDRFNNSSRPTKFYFFPGSARTIADDAYTFLWVPYPFRRPGEAVSLGIQGGIYKYVQGGMTTNFEYAPSTKQNSYLMNYNYQWGSSSLSNGFRFQKKYTGDREIELNAVEGNLFKSSNAVSLGALLKRKEKVGSKETLHGSYGITMGLRPPGDERTCIYGLYSSYENAPENWSKGFSYIRKLGLVSGECRVTYQIGFGIRAFVGRMKGGGQLPESAFFKPNELGESRLRIDLSLPTVSEIDTVTSDLNFPLYLPLPFDFLILSRQLRWRLFYDIGHAPAANINYMSSGVGFQMPIGGDLSGAGSLAFTKLTFLVILKSWAGDTKSKRPSVLFDFTGQL